MLWAKSLSAARTWEVSSKRLFAVGSCAVSMPVLTPHFKIPFTKGAEDWVVETVSAPASRVLAMDGVEKLHAVQRDCQNGHESCAQFNPKKLLSHLPLSVCAMERCSRPRAHMQSTCPSGSFGLTCSSGTAYMTLGYVFPPASLKKDAVRLGNL